MNSLISKQKLNPCYMIWNSFPVLKYNLPHHRQLASGNCFYNVYCFYIWFSYVRKWRHKLLQMNSFMFCLRQCKTKIAYRWIQKRDNKHHPIHTLYEFIFVWIHIFKVQKYTNSYWIHRIYEFACCMSSYIPHDEE